MFSSPTGPGPASAKQYRILSRTKILTLAVLCIVLVVLWIVMWVTRGSTSKLPFAPGQKNTSPAGTSGNVVDISPWQTAQALAALAVTAEEKDFARDAERLADHSVDQAFAAALREANLRAEHAAPTGSAADLAQQVQQLQQYVAQDKAAVDKLSTPNGAGKASTAAPAESNDDDLNIAKAQLQLDTDELADLTDDLGRAEGDERSEINSELAAHEATMKKYDAGEQEPGQLAALSVNRFGTLAGRLGALNSLHSRQQLIEQASQQAESLAQKLTATRDPLQAALKSSASQGSVIFETPAARIARLKDTSARRQLLSIYSDRIDTEKRLAAVYTKWYAQVQLQKAIVLHLIMSSLAWIVVVLLCVVVGDVIVRRLMEIPALDPRNRHTMRSVLELAIHIAGIIGILLIVFGAPQQTATMIGLGTAALTIALQDFIIAFLGWFVLIGSKGIRVGDLVEIDGVGGEVIGIGLMTTTLLETSSLSDGGYPTGRHITLMNGFAIRGKYFNFSTAGQWMWDQFEVAIPATEDTHLLAERIRKAVTDETAQNTQLAEREWAHAAKGTGLDRLSASPSVNLRPAAGGFELEVRYVTSAAGRAETRNVLYRCVIEMLRGPNQPVPAGSAAENQAKLEPRADAGPAFDKSR